MFPTLPCPQIQYIRWEPYQITNWSLSRWCWVCVFWRKQRWMRIKRVIMWYTEVVQEPGASTQDPTHDKVMRRRPDKQGRSGLQRFRKAAPAFTLKMISIFLMLAILDCSLISVTQAEDLPQSLSEQNQLKTLINMSPGRWHPIRLSGMKRVFWSKPLLLAF